MSSTGFQPVCLFGTPSARGCPCPIAGRSPRPSGPRLTRCCPRFTILAALGQQRRLTGHGAAPRSPLVAQVFNLCGFLGHLGGSSARTSSDRRLEWQVRSAGRLTVAPGASRRRGRPMTVEKLNAWWIAVVAAVAGVAVGAGTAFLQRSSPWTVGDLRVTSTPVGPAPQVEAIETRHAFGTLGTGGVGSHEFVVRNAGGGPLTLRKGTTSCTCTVSDFEAIEGGSADGTRVVPPGDETKIRVQWKAKPPGGPFRQQATILTDDPRRPEVVFTVECQRGRQFPTCSPCRGYWPLPASV